MGFDVRGRYLKNTTYKNDTSRLENMDLSLEKDKERDKYMRQRALEMIKEKTAFDKQSTSNAGDNRTTEISYKMPEQRTIGNAIIPSYSGMNIASNGADVDQSKFKTEATTSKGWKGINFGGNQQSISKEESLAHATEVFKPYENDEKIKELFNQYVEASDWAASDAAAGNSGYIKYRAVRNKNKLAEQIKEATGMSDDEFKQVAENYTYLKHDEQRQEQQQRLNEAGPAAKTALTLANIPTAAIGNFQAAVGALKKSSDPELGRDYNAVAFTARNLNQDVKEAVHKDIDESTMNDYAKFAANFGYDAFTMGAESLASQGLGGAGLASFFAGGYVNSLEEGEQRGLSKGQAQGYALANGTLEYVTERLPWNNLKGILSGSAVGKSAVKGSLKPYISALLKQAGEEAGEEVVNGIGDMVADALINGDKSKMNNAINSYMADGMSEEEATRKAFFDEGKEILYAAATAAVSAGASAGPALAAQAVGVTRQGKNIVKNAQGISDEESPYYIPDTRESYVSDQDFEQAMNTREAINDAARGKVTGRQARAIAEDFSETYSNLNQAENKRAVEEYEKQSEESNEEVEEKPQKTYQEIFEDIEFASTPYQLAKAIEQVTEETDEIKELIDFKKQELEMFNFKAEEVESVITPKKALEMGQKGENVTEEQLQSIPEQDRQEVLEANNQAYNKAILREHPDAVVDKSTGKYFVPLEVKLEGADVVIVDSEGNSHTDFENPRINQVMNAITKTSVDTRGHATEQSKYNTNVQQAAYAIELAVKSPEATSALVRTAVESILDTASVGHKSWDEYLKTSKGLFTKVDEATAEKLYKSIQEPARKSDSRKTENVEGKKTSDKVVSDTLRENLSEETVSLLEALGKKIGYNFVASTNPNARGSITPGTRQISIGTNSLDELWSITTHEAIAEYLQAHGKEEDVIAIQDDMLKYLENKLGSKAFNDLIDQYQTVYRSSAKKGSVDDAKSRRAAANEMFNDTVFALVSSEEGLKDYVNWLNGNNTEVSFFQKVKDFFSKLFDYVSNYIQSGSFNAAERAALEMDLKTAREFRDRVFKAMDEAIENANSNAESNYNSNEEQQRQSIKVDNDYIAAVQSNNMDKISKMLDKAAKEAGYDVKKLYHGTNKFGFTEFKKDFLDDKNSIFVSEDINVASSYTDAEAKVKTIDKGFNGNVWDMPDEDVWKLYNKTFNTDYRIPTDKEIKEDLDLQRDKLTSGIEKLNKLLKENDFEEEDKKVFKEAIADLKTIATTESREDFSDAYAGFNFAKWNFIDDDVADIFQSAITDEQYEAISYLYQRIEIENKFFVTDNGIEIDWTNALLDRLDRYYKHGIYELYGKADNLYELDAKGANWDKIKAPEEMLNAGFEEYVKTREISKYARKKGYTGVRILNVKDSGGKTEGVHYPGNVRIYFDSSSLKSADPITYDNYGNIVSLSDRFDDTKSDLRYSIKVDSQGRDLTKEQQEYFKDSKVLDEEGNLKVVYHGTNREFTIFDLDMARGTEDIEAFFFSGDIDEAGGYGNVGEYYLNITNPADYDTAYDIFFKYKGQEGAGIKAREELQSLGYDGVIATDEDAPEYTEYLAFRSNQIKRIDNIKPTENEDIRYSKKVNSDGDPLSLQQQEVFKNTKAVDKKGNLLVLYHGSQEKFNTFDMNAKGVVNGRAFGDGYYFTPYEQVAKSWGDKNIYKVYLNITKPYYANKSNNVPADVKKLIRNRYEQSYGNDHAHINARLAYLSEVKNAYDALEVLSRYNMLDAIKSLGYDGIIYDKPEDKNAVQYVAFYPEQIKRTDNYNPIVDSSDIRNSIKVDFDENTVDIPARNYKDMVFFEGTDEEVEAAEMQDLQVMATYANIIQSKGFVGLMFSWKEDWGGRSGVHEEQAYVTRSTREGEDWHFSKGRDGVPLGHQWYTNDNDILELYKGDNHDLSTLYRDLMHDTPKEGVKVYVIREGAAEDARNSIKVYGEASPYADSLNESRVIQTMIGTMSNALSKADAFAISNEELMRIENYIANKYKTELEPGEIAANVAYAFAHMQKGELDTDYENMMNYLLNIGDEVIKQSKMVDPASKELYDQARATVSSRKFKLSDEERAEILSAFGGSWKVAFGAMQKAGIKLDNTNGSSIDTVFSEIREEMLKAAGIDMSYADKPSQQILSIIDTLTALEPTPYLWDGANDLDKALTVVSDIVEQYYSIATEQLEANVAKGTAKGNKKIKDAINTEKARLRGQWAKYKTEKAEEFNSIVAEKNQIIQQQQNQIKQQQEQMKQWNKDAKEKERAVVLDKRQMEATAKLQAKQAVQNYKDREERARQIENIKKTGIRLIKWLDNPTDNQHVPAFLQRPLAEFLAAIDFLPTNAKANSKSTLSWHQRMQELRETLVKIKDAEVDGENSAESYFAQNIVAKELIAMMDEFLGKEEFDEFTQSYILTKRAAKKVSLLDAKELANLNKIMSALSTSINNMNKTYANSVFKEVSALAKASVSEVDALPAKKDMQKMVGSVFNFLNFDEVEPITYFEGLGEGAKSVFQELRDGFNLKTKHVREADQYMEEAKKELGISDKELSTWKNQLHTFKLTEGTVMLNTTQIMSLYKILGRKQGRPHVAVGGIKAADFEYKDGKVIKKHHQAKATHIRATEAQAIIDTLTDEQKALADKMQEYMASDCAAWGNRVTEKMYGYKKYEEKDYFPLKTDAHSRATTASSDANVSYYTIKNSSFTKPITPMANNAVVLDDIFDVFTDHVVSMADYDAYVMPIADAMRWFNYSERVINAIAPDELNEQGARIDYLGNMQESIDRVYGDAGLSYFKQFIKDINGDYAGRGGKSEILSSLMSMYKAQAVGANMRVVIQQPTAVVRAADQIEAKYLLKALTSIPKAIEYAKKAQSNSEIAYWKAQGYYETYLGQSFKEIITGDTTLKDKFNDWSGFLAGQADDLSWGIMYRACEIKVSEMNPELTGAAYDKAVTKMFEDIVDHTQVVDTIFHKSQWMRSQELGHKVTSAFMAEPTKTYNMLYRAYRDAKLSGNKGIAIKRLRQVALIFLFEQLLNAMITGGWDALRDDEKEDYLSSFRKNFSENAIDNLNPLNLLPIAKEITSAIQGYDATAYTTDAIYTAVDSFNVLVKIAQGKSTKTLYGNIYQIAKAASQLTGVPVANVMREFKTLYNLVNDFWGGKDLVNTQSQEKKIEKTKETKRVSAVFDENNLSSAKAEVQAKYNDYIAAGKEESEAWSAARDMLKEQFQRQLEEHPEEKQALINRYSQLYATTKHKVSGKYKNYTVEEAKKKMQEYNWY